MPRVFENVDLEETRQSLENYYLKEFLPDGVCRDEDEDAARETMFNKLSELAKVISGLKKKRK